MTFVRANRVLGSCDADVRLLALALAGQVVAQIDPTHLSVVRLYHETQPRFQALGLRNVGSNCLRRAGGQVGKEMAPFSLGTVKTPPPQKNTTVRIQILREGGD